MSTDRAEKQPKLPDKSERLKHLIDHHVPTKAQSSSSADEHMETFEVAASDNGCNSRLGMKQGETVDLESDVEESSDWFMGNEDACIFKH